MNNLYTIQALFSTALFAAKISSHVKRSKEKDDQEDVHHSDVCHEEIAVKNSSVKEPSLLHRKHHVKKASIANDLSEEMDSQKPISPGFPPQETESSERGPNSDEHGSSSSIQDAILPKVHINTYTTQNVGHIALPNENGHIISFVSPGERAELVELEDGTRGGSQHSMSRSTSVLYIQDTEMKNYFKLVCGMFTISCGGFIAIFVDLLGKNYSHDHHKVFLKTAYTLCVYASCIICLCVIAIYFLCPHTVQVVRIVKFLTWIVLATLAYALALIVCLTTPVGVVEEVAVLVLPILPVGLVGLIRAKYKSN